MLSAEALWCLNVSFRNGRKFSSIPLIWDKKTGVVSVSKHLWRWKTVALILFAYAIFAFIRLVQSYFFLGLPLHRCILQVYFVISSFYFATAHLSYWFNYNDHAMFWTRFLQFDRDYSVDNFNGVEKDWAGLILKCLCFMNYVHMVFQGAGFLFIRKSPNFVYSLIWEIWEVDYISLRILFAIFELFIMFYSWTGCQLIHAATLLFPYTIRRWNDHVHDNASRAWKTQKAQYYRCAQILVSNFSAAYSSIALPSQDFAVLFGGIICTYATIRFYGIIPLFIYLTMPTSVCIMLFYEKIFQGGSSYIYISSAKLLSNYEVALRNDAWEAYHRVKSATVPVVARAGPGWPMPVVNSSVQDLAAINHLQKKVSSSFYPFGISVSGFYTIKSGTIMTFGSLVLGNAINLLLA